MTETSQSQSQYPSLVWHLKNTKLFQDLTPDELEKITRITPYKRFAAGEIIYHMEDPADALYFVRDGMVKISMYFPNGKEMILGLLGQYDIFGELLLLESERRPNQAEAVVDTTLIVMPEEEFQRLLQQHPKIAMKFIQVMSTRLWQAQQWQAEVGAFDAPGRLANLLLRLASDFGVPSELGTVIDLNLTQQDLAKMIGATRETVSHCLARLLEYGAVRRRRAPITVNTEKPQQLLHAARAQRPARAGRAPPGPPPADGSAAVQTDPCPARRRAAGRGAARRRRAAPRLDPRVDEGEQRAGRLALGVGGLGHDADLPVLDDEQRNGAVPVRPDEVGEGVLVGERHLHELGARAVEPLQAVVREPALR